jgi:hypothetical protein
VPGRQRHGPARSRRPARRLCLAELLTLLENGCYRKRSGLRWRVSVGPRPRRFDQRAAYGQLVCGGRGRTGCLGHVVGVAGNCGS